MIRYLHAQGHANSIPCSMDPTDPATVSCSVFPLKLLVQGKSKNTDFKIQSIILLQCLTKRTQLSVFYLLKEISWEGNTDFAETKKLRYGLKCNYDVNNHNHVQCSYCDFKSTLINLCKRIQDTKATINFIT